MADDSNPRNPDSQTPESNPAYTEGSRPEFRIVGATEARQLISDASADKRPDQEDDPSVSATDHQGSGDGEGSNDDGGWMEVGDRTLAEVMGIVPHEDEMGQQIEAAIPEKASVRSALSIPFTPSTLGASKVQGQLDVESGSGVETDDDLDDNLDDEVFDDERFDDGFDDDVFPEEMYSGQAARTTPSDRRFVPREVESVLPSQTEESAAPARRKIAVPPASDGGDGWSSFAGSGPRWRDEAKDWRDVDGEDPSAFGDDQTRVGALDPERSGASDLYVFAEGDPRKSTPSASGSASASAVGAKGDPGIIKIDATKRSELDALSSGSQQRPSSTGSRQARSGSSKAETEAAPKQGRAAGLGERIVTGVALALVVGFIFYIGKNVGAAVVTGLAVLLAALELANALKRRAFRPAIPVIGVGVIAVVAAGMFRGERGVLIAIVLTVLSTLAWFLFGVERERPTVNIAATLLAFVYPGIAAACAALLLDTRHGTGLLMAAVACTVGHDVFAYFCGRFLGRTKLAPEISPNKTVEGLIGGMIGSVLIGGILLGKIGWHPWQSVTHGLIVGLAVALAAPAGDLIESQLKRDLDIKDMGSVLPGHGGVLDRIDAMLVAVPAVWLVAIALRLI